MVFRSEKKLSKEIFLNETIGSDKEGNEISLIDITASDEEELLTQIIHKDNLGMLGRLIDENLTQREREIIYLRYGIGGAGRQTAQREIAKMFGISRSYVSRIEKRALEKLKAAYEKN